MVITILSEPRSGSTNFANWFFFDKRFTVFFLPSDPHSKWYKKETPKEYRYKTEHLVVKEDFYHYKNYTELIEISEKIIFLFRENESQQIESWCNSKNTGNWDKSWVWKNQICPENEIIFFKNLKKEFKKTMLSTQKGITISYEDLYENSGINRVIEYLNIDDMGINSWPIGEKYRIDINDSKTRNII